MALQQRPLSPHLQIYRWKLHMVMSILHRASGVALGFGTLMLAWWLMAIAAGPKSYRIFSDFIVHPIGRLILFGFSFALIFHLLNGVRHLYWDMGKGFEPAIVKKTGQLVLVSSLVLTVAAWLAGYYLLGKL